MEKKESKHSVEEIDQIVGLGTGLDTSATDAQKANLKGALGITDLELKINDVEFDLTSYTQYGGIIQNSAWAAVASGGKYMHIVVPITAGCVYRIVAGANGSASYAFLASYTSTSSAPDFATGYTNAVSLAASETVSVTAPTDAQYLYLLAVNSFTDRLPSSLSQLAAENVFNVLGEKKEDLFISSKTPILTYIDDDTDISSIPTVKSLCDELGIKCTFACITSRLTSVEGLKDLLLSYQQEGFHITCHSHTHSGWYETGDAQFTIQECEEDLIKALYALNTNGFLDSGIFVYPGNSQTRTGLDAIIKKWCKAAMYGGDGVNTLYGNGRFGITRAQFDKSSHNAAYYEGIVDNAYNSGSWMVIFGHSANSTEFDADMVKTVLQYAIDKGMRIATANEALNIRMGMYQIHELFK